MVKRIAEALRSEDGATMVEYALMLAFIAMACIAAVALLGGATNNSLSASASQMPE